MENNGTCRVILVGKTGSGKSASGNSILGRKAFADECTPNSVTHKIKAAQSADCHGKNIIVVDTPGLFDTKKVMIHTAFTIQDSLEFVRPGPHAFLVVLNAAVRFTKEEEMTIETLMIMFGPKFINHSIIIFTHADQVNNFDEYLKQCMQDEKLKCVLDQCGQRVIKINNKEMNSEMIKGKQEELMRMVAEISDNGTQCYQEDLSVYRTCLEKHAKSWSDTKWDIKRIVLILDEQKKELARMEREMQKQMQKEEKVKQMQLQKMEKENQLKLRTMEKEAQEQEKKRNREMKSQLQKIKRESQERDKEMKEERKEEKEMLKKEKQKMKKMEKEMQMERKKKKKLPNEEGEDANREMQRIEKEKELQGQIEDINRQLREQKEITEKERQAKTEIMMTLLKDAKEKKQQNTTDAPESNILSKGIGAAIGLIAGAAVSLFGSPVLGVAVGSAVGQGVTNVASLITATNSSDNS